MSLLELLLDAVDDGLGVGAAQAQHQCPDRLALAIGGHHAVARHGADAHVGDVADANDGGRAAGRDDDVAHVVERLDAAVGAHQQRFLAFAHAAGAVVAIVGADRRFRASAW